MYPTLGSFAFGLTLPSKAVTHFSRELLGWLGPAHFKVLPMVYPSCVRSVPVSHQWTLKQFHTGCWRTRLSLTPTNFLLTCGGIPTVPALERQRQEDLREFKSSLLYIGIPRKYKPTPSSLLRSTIKQWLLLQKT